MNNCCICNSNIPRYQYLVKTNDTKTNNEQLNANDYLNIGYMAGRYGINLQNPNAPQNIRLTQNGIVFDINSCTAGLFENNLNQAGIKFNRIA